jgi:hypothetical protein
MSRSLNIPEGYSVQFGAGLCAPDSWQNFDVSPTLLLSRIPMVSSLLKMPKWPRNVRFGNVVSGLPLSKSSCARVYSDQVLEHLSLESLRRALRNIFDMMMPGGVFRSFTPDLKHSIRLYEKAVAGGNASDAASIFVRAIGMGVESTSSFRDKLREHFGNSRHLWIWDEQSICRELEAAGFGDFRRALYLDSGDSLFDSIESCSEWRHEQLALGFEVRKA